jgi:poly-gamma-glutamate capsule biosynthesis protein CapA/YwtB (metallophosphatase superfamily)
VDFIIHGTLTLIRRIRDGFLLLVIFIGIGIHPLPPSAQLVFMGDVMLGRGVARAHAVVVPKNNSDEGFLPERPLVDKATWDEAFKELASHIKRADLALANLESPLTWSQLDLYKENYDMRYNLCAPSESQEALNVVGMDVLTVANNHLSDCDLRKEANNLQDSGAVNETVQILEKHNMTPVGGYQIVWEYMNTLPIALVAFDDVTLPLDINAAVEVIRIARRSGGIVVVSIHWGEEYSSTPSARQQMLAKALADAGALIIWGHHPHVLQKAVWMQGEDQPFRTLVAYSLGNALFDQVVPMDVNRSALLKVEFNSYGIMGVEAIPFIIDPNHGEVHMAGNEVESFVYDRLGIEDLLAHQLQ